MSQRRPIKPRLPPVCRDPLPPDPPVSLALAPRAWLARAAGECAFPVDGESWTTRACCNPAAAGPYCLAHARLMRAGRSGAEAAR